MVLRLRHQGAGCAGHRLRHQDVQDIGRLRHQEEGLGLHRVQVAQDLVPDLHHVQVVPDLVPDPVPDLVPDPVPDPVPGPVRVQAVPGLHHAPLEIRGADLRVLAGRSAPVEFIRCAAECM